VPDPLRNSQTNQEVHNVISGSSKGSHMRLMLTGISQETHFSPPSSICYLVFNNGDLKVPVTEEQAQLVLEQLDPMLRSGDEEEEKEYLPTPPPRSVPILIPVPDHDVTDTEEEEDGVGQA